MAGWRVTDYNLNKMRSYSDRKVNTELSRLKRITASRIATFEKHLSDKPGRQIPKNVQEANEILGTLNNIRGLSRRERERALMELRRFTRGSTSTYTAYERARREQLKTWKGFGLNISNRDLDDFYDFLNWAKSISGGKYEINAVKEVWNLSRKNVETAMEIFEELAT